jgi:hypothetical protein
MSLALNVGGVLVWFVTAAVCYSCGLLQLRFVTAAVLVWFVTAAVLFWFVTAAVLVWFVTAAGLVWFVTAAVFISFGNIRQ